MSDNKKRSTAVLRDDMIFLGQSSNGYTIPLDAKKEAGGHDAGISPIELLLTSLAGCTAMDVVSILRKKRQNMSGFEIRIHGDRTTDHPKVFTDFELEYVVHGVDIDPAAVERAIQLSTETYCSAHAMLEKAAHIRTRFTIINE